ncbi:tetratricopeptide repeat protein [Lyngbya sp. PCC 8106]|uniref:tetratricopeptide repeat protein n=1 Tax=Lyngbya sp. (strain PCC 8106) TaxID=313612 RepID=UPI0000EAC32F|nr:tetratricopeptide repeat protein [Lyngbya sp. PCC 8106]EAW33958.1 TPR repeat protein [Lyngbya sp. PCC 8106]
MKSTSSLQSRLKVLRKTGLQQLNQEQLLPALNTFQQVLAIAQETESLEYHVEALHQIGLIHYSLKHYTWSINCLKQIIKLADANSNSLRVATVYNDIARVYCATKQYSQALRYSAQALENFLKLSHLKGIGMTLNYLGEIYNHLGMFEQTLQCCRKALLIFQYLDDTIQEDNLKNSVHEAAALHNLGLAEYHLDRPRQALAFLNQALNIRQKLCSAKQNQAQDEQKYSAKSVKIYSEIAKNLGQIGIVYFSIKEYKTAIDFYKNAIKIYQQHHQLEEQAKLMNYIGIACYKKADISQALWYHLRALELFEKIQNSQYKENYLPHILSVYQRFNICDQGVKLYQRVQELFQVMETEVS